MILSMILNCLNIILISVRFALMFALSFYSTLSLKILLIQKLLLILTLTLTLMLKISLISRLRRSIDLIDS